MFTKSHAKIAMPHTLVRPKNRQELKNTRTTANRYRLNLLS